MAEVTLGKRYIAVVCHPDRPDQSSWAVATMRETEGGVYAPRNPYGCDCDQRHEISKLVVDLDELPAPDLSDSDRYEWAERQLLFFTAEEERLRPIAKVKLGEEAIVPDSVRMRAVIEAMRPIVDAALEWNKVREFCGRGSPQGRATFAAVSANRERLGLAMSAWENSQTLSADEKAIAHAHMLTPPEWSALFELQKEVESDLAVNRVSGPFRGTFKRFDCNREGVVSAINKLRTQADPFRSAAERSKRR